MNSSEAYQELLEEIQNDLEEAVEEDNWDGITLQKVIGEQ